MQSFADALFSLKKKKPATAHVDPTGTDRMILVSAV
jgi:hypothetical protein